MKINFYFIIWIIFFSGSISYAQSYNMTNGGNTSTCTGTFMDPGGASNYPGNQNSTITHTFCSNNGDILQMTFNSFSLFSNGCIWGTSVDKLKIYDGPNTSSPLIGSYRDGQLAGQTIYGSTGCLTFVFVREDNGGLGCAKNNGAPGWSATISCVTSIPPTGDNCPTALPFCSDISYNFPNQTSTTSPSGPNYGCLITQPNPVWYYMKIGTSGPMQLSLAQYDNSNSGIDIDFALWGPFTDVSSGCNQIMGGGLAPLQCSFSAAPTETIGLGLPGGYSGGASTPPNAVAGQYYILLLTNYSGFPGYITLSQTSGTGQTDCSIVQPCQITNVTATPSVCDPSSNSYTVSGQVTFNDAPSTGTLIVTDCNGHTATLNQPFTSPMSYTITGIPASGGTCFVTASFSDEGGCSKTSLDYNAPLATTPTFTNPGPICSGAALSLPNTSTNGISGTWSPAINNTDTTTYTFTHSAGQCATDTSITVVVNPNITPSFTNPGPICSGATLSLPITSSNGISGTWSPAINNTDTTTYTFTHSAGQCATNTSMTVIVNPNILPTFTNPGPLCTGTSFSLPNTSTNGINGTWTPSINNILTTQYTFTPSAGQCSTTDTMTVVINSLLDPTFTNPGPICSGSSFTLPTTSSNGITGSWLPAINNTTTTLYTFTPLTGLCSALKTMTVTVNQLPSFTLSSTNPTTCSAVDGTITFSGLTANTPYDISYNGNSPTSLTSDGSGSITLSGLSSGAYTSFTVTTAAGCSTTDNSVINLVSPATPTISASGTTICIGSSAVITSTGTPSGGSYSWNNGAGTTSSATVSPNTTTTYTVTYTNNGCSVTDTAIVTVNQKITPTFNNPGPICSGNSFILPTTSDNGINGTWTPAINKTVTTTYTFTPTANQCSNNQTMTVNISQYPTAGFFANPTSVMEDSAIVNFTNQSSGGSKYEWNFGDNSNIDNSQNPTHTFPSVPGDYIVILTVSNNDGCQSTHQDTITVKPVIIDYKLPNVFTPNGDNTNDFFKFIYQKGIVSIKLTVLNRWGNVVFVSDDVNFEWNGKVKNNGDECTDGVYYYTIIIKAKENKEFKESGFVHLTR